MYSTHQVIGDVMLVIVGLNWRSPKDGIERRTQVKVSISTGIGTYMMKDPSILKKMRRLAPVYEI